MNMLGQLFVRDTGELGENVYLVCGLIKTDEPLEAETVHVIRSDQVRVLDSKDRHEQSEGRGLDDIVKMPIWRKFR